MTAKAFFRGSATLGYNAKSAVLLVLGLGLFAGIVALTLETVAGAFEPTGTPLLRSETFRTSETPFRGWALPQVVALVIFALAVMAFGAITLVLRNRLAGMASAACLLVLLGLVLFTPIGRYGAGAQRPVHRVGIRNDIRHPRQTTLRRRYPVPGTLSPMTDPRISSRTSTSRPTCGPAGFPPRLLFSRFRAPAKGPIYASRS